MKPLGADLLEWARTCGLFKPEDLDAMQATYARQLAIQQQLREGRPNGGVVFGPPSDWLHDGTERREHSQPGYRCPQCNDAGFVRRELPVGDPDFGKAFPCSCTYEQAEMRHAAWERRVSRSWLDAALMSKTLENFRRVKGTHEAWAAAQEFVKAHERGEPLWVALFGPPGSGKTHLLVAITQACLLRGDVRWVDARELRAACQADQFAQEATYTEVCIEAPVLVLDEFGSAGTDAWWREKLELIVDKRYAAQRWTALGLTITTAELAAWSPRIASRLDDRSLVRAASLTGGDYRKRLERKELRDGD